MAGPFLVAGVRHTQRNSIDMVLVSTDIVGKFGVTPNTTKSDLRKLTEKGYLSEISLNGRTKGYVNTFPD